MTQPLPPLPKAAPTIPTTVRVAFYFQLAVAAMLLLFVGAVIARAVHYDGLITEAALPTAADPAIVADERSINLTGTLFPAIPALILAIWLGITAFLVRRGSNVGRILTFVGMGAPVALFLSGCLVGGFGLFVFFGSLAAGGIDEEDPYADEPFPDDTDYYPDSFTGDAFYDRLYALDNGGWSIAYEVISFSALLLALACAIVTVVLLLTGPSGRFFRPGRAVTPPRPLPYGYGMPPAYPAPMPPYPAPSYPSPSFPAPSYPSAAFPAPSYPSPASPAPGYPGAAFPAPSYPSAAFPEPGYPGSAFPQPSAPFPQPPSPFAPPSPYARPPQAFPIPDQTGPAPVSSPADSSSPSSEPASSPAEVSSPSSEPASPTTEVSSPSPGPATDQPTPPSPPAA
ncbi:hypothetical protein ACQPZJ_34265 [Actinoplanes sp. CA-054009]